MKKTLAILLGVLLCALTVLPAAAQIYSQAEWEDYFYGTPDATRGLIMQPGRNETERYFSWLLPDGSSDFYVSVSENAGMTNTTHYHGIVKYVDGKPAAKVTVTGLKPSRTYYYNVRDASGRSGVYSFRTAEGNNFTAMYVTDIHITSSSYVSHGRKFENVTSDAETMADGKLDLILSAGDQASNGSLTEYIGMTAGKTAKGISFATTIGNHDFGSGSDYYNFVNTPNHGDPVNAQYNGDDYWFVKGDTLFIVLDSNDLNGDGHNAVMRRAIGLHPTVKWRIVMMHHDLYSKVMSDREREAARIRPLLTPLFDMYDIDLVLLGHTHYFSVSNLMFGNVSRKPITNNCTLKNEDGTVYLVSGSLNRPRKDSVPSYSDDIAVGVPDLSRLVYNLIDFTPDKLTVKAIYYDTDEIFNTFTLQKTGSARRGDIDQDGFITAADARLALRRSVDLESYRPKTTPYLAADFNCDNVVSAADARAILRMCVGLYPGPYA